MNSQPSPRPRPAPLGTAPLRPKAPPRVRPLPCRGSAPSARGPALTGPQHHDAAAPAQVCGRLVGHVRPRFQHLAVDYKERHAEDNQEPCAWVGPEMGTRLDRSLGTPETEQDNSEKLSKTHPGDSRTETQRDLLKARKKAQGGGGAGGADAEVGVGSGGTPSPEPTYQCRC